jgi:hypothetical protein
MNTSAIIAAIGCAVVGAALTVSFVILPAPELGPPIYSTDFLLKHPHEREAIRLQCATLSRRNPGCEAAEEAQRLSVAYEAVARAERTRRIRELTCGGRDVC